MTWGERRLFNRCGDLVARINERGGARVLTFAVQARQSAQDPNNPPLK
jgi:hypothetical protein